MLMPFLIFGCVCLFAGAVVLAAKFWQDCRLLQIELDRNSRETREMKSVYGTAETYRVAMVRALREADDAKANAEKWEREAHEKSAQIDEIRKDLDLKIAQTLDAGLDEACGRVAHETEARCVAKFRSVMLEHLRRHEDVLAQLNSRIASQAAVISDYKAVLAEERAARVHHPAFLAAIDRLIREVRDDVLQELTPDTHDQALARLEETVEFLRFHGVRKERTDKLFEGLEERHRQLIHEAITRAGK